MRAYFIVLLAILAAPVAAQEAPPGTPVTAEEAIANAKEVYGPPDIRERRRLCPPQKAGGEIVVCAQNEDPERLRVEGSESDGTEGDPRAPNLETQYPGAGFGAGVVFKGCFIPPCPPPMPPLIDLKAIPEAPPGSDADRVARGLAPRGRDDLPIEAVETEAVTPPE
ncbi:hypothetical protein A6F68_00592 [Tsuneonella dongtanensis]|uniref:Uncharacterized protein n=1 Tax=Tsuneonella dongtanensis TaxID=692370 RepID=A0A1B2AAP5_9SPHN|nr:hypothetical protein [Tsuneonella dongtanensis]ANY19125.1 hypothetical protein A6F68_00592 [Tsuneonella dongtanensis]